MQYLDHLFTLLHYSLFTFGCWFLAEPHALFRPLLVSSARCWFLAEPHPLLRSWCWFLAEPHPLPSPPLPTLAPPSYARCWFLAEPHPLLRHSETPKAYYFNFLFGRDFESCVWVLLLSQLASQFQLWLADLLSSLPTCCLALWLADFTFS